MAHYKVRYSVSSKNEYIYPKSVSKAVWKSTAYHYTDQVMVGETETRVVADGKEVIALKPAQAAKLNKEFLSSYPTPQALPDMPLLPEHVAAKRRPQKRQHRKKKKSRHA